MEWLLSFLATLSGFPFVKYPTETRPFLSFFSSAKIMLPLQTCATCSLFSLTRCLLPLPLRAASPHDHRADHDAQEETLQLHQPGRHTTGWFEYYSITHATPRTYYSGASWCDGCCFAAGCCSVCQLTAAAVPGDHIRRTMGEEIFPLLCWLRDTINSRATAVWRLGGMESSKIINFFWCTRKTLQFCAVVDPTLL